MTTGDGEPTAAEANEAIRAYAWARRGRCCWSVEECAELDRLRRAWLDAVARELDVAA